MLWQEKLSGIQSSINNYYAGTKANNFFLAQWPCLPDSTVQYSVLQYGGAKEMWVVNMTLGPCAREAHTGW